MTKAQLLADLAALDFVDWVGSVGDPSDEFTDNGVNIRTYSVRYAETSGKAGALFDQVFYVINEGQGGETALYKNGTPISRSKGYDMREWIITTKSGNPGNFRGLAVFWMSDLFEEVVYAKLNTSTGAIEYFHTTKGTPPTTVQLTGTIDEILTYIQALQASQIQV